MLLYFTRVLYQSVERTGGNPMKFFRGGYTLIKNKVSFIRVILKY